MFGVCCNNTLPAGFRIPEDVETSAPESDDEVFPIEASEAELSANCGARFVRPQVTLYNQPTAAQRFFAALPYIVNGNEAIRHEYPFMVSRLLQAPHNNIHFISQAALMNRNRQFCGGSLIDSNHVLTAAHCVAQ